MDGVGIIFSAGPDSDPVVHRVQKQFHVLHILKLVQTGRIESQLSSGDRHGRCRKRRKEFSPDSRVASHIHTVGLECYFQLLIIGIHAFRSGCIILRREAAPVLIDRNESSQDAVINHAKNRKRFTLP